MTSSRTISKLSRCIIETLEPRQMLSAGALDTSFSLDGKATVNFGEGLFATDVAVQADGKTVVVGDTGGSREQFAIARFNFDGSLDKTFGPGQHGITITDLGDTGRSGANAVAIQPDGKIVVVGSTRIDDLFGDHDEFAIARYTSDGILDKTFDGDGMTSVRLQDESEANDVVLQRDGKIVIAGSTFDEGIFNPADTDFAVVRLNPDGSLDPSFDGDGKQTIDFSGVDDEAEAVAIDYSGTAATNPNFGKILLAGDTKVSAVNGSQRIALARLNSNGRLDTSFNSEGKVYTTFPGHPLSRASGLLIQSSGKIVIAGSTGGFAGNWQFALARYDANGKLDPTFGTRGDGLVETGFGGNDLGQDIIPSANGGLIVGGLVNGQLALGGYTADGVLDNTFGTGGRVKLDLGPAFAVGLAAGPGNRFVLAGGKDFATARFLDTGANQVFVRSFEPNAAEAGPRSATFVVGRTERLPVPTHVFFSIGGTATAPGTFPFSQVDYTLEGMSFDSLPTGTFGTLAARAVIGAGVTASPLTPFGLPYVEIPANQTTALVTLRPIDDNRFEPNETATFSILPNPAYEAPTFSRTTLTIFDNDPITINFQPAGVAPAGTQTDTGQIFGLRANGLSYGWDADNTANARQRHNTRSPDALFDSFNHMQKNGANRKWEIAVPNGQYQVTLAAGDPDAIDSIYKMNLEGTLALSGTPTGDTHWFTRTIDVKVNDGRLTLTNAIGAKNNKIDFITIQAVPQAGPPTHFNSSVAITLLPLPVVTIVFGFKKDLGSTFAKTLLQ